MHKIYTFYVDMLIFILEMEKAYTNRSSKWKQYNDNFELV